MHSFSPNRWDTLLKNIRSFSRYRRFLDEKKPDLEDGLCFGLTHMWIQAILCQEEEKFVTRLMDLSGKTINLNSLKKNKLYEIYAFIDGILLYQYPIHFPIVECTTSNALITSRLIMPKKFEKQIKNNEKDNHPNQYKAAKLIIVDTIPIIGKFPLVYNILAKILNILNQATELRHPYAISFSSINHIIGSGYDPTRRKLLLFDQKFLRFFKFTNSISAEIKDMFVFTNKIFNSFAVKNDEDCCPFSLTIYFPPNQTTIKIIQKMKANNSFESFEKIKMEMCENYQYLSPDGVSLLHIACKSGHFEVVKFLVAQKNMDINQANKKDMTPLYFACARGYSKIVEFLLKQKNIAVNQANKNNITPLHSACAYNNFEVVKILLKQEKIEINKASIDKITPLYFVCQNDYFETVKLLLEHKDINVNQVDKREISPLHIACYYNRFKVVKILLKHKNIDVNRVDMSKETPQDIAHKKNYSKIVDILLKYKQPPLKLQQMAVREYKKGISFKNKKGNVQAFFCFDEADWFISIAINKFLKQNKSTAVAVCYSVRVSIFRELGELQEAKNLCELAIKYCRKKCKTSPTLSKLRVKLNKIAAMMRKKLNK